jgi:hypothetical protein
MSARPAASTPPTALLRELFAATPLGILTDAVRKILQARAPRSLHSATVPAGGVPR